MKLLDLNVWAGRLGPQIADFLKREKPDVLCLQEVIDIEGGQAQIFISLDEIKEITRLPYVYISPVFSFKYGDRMAHFGNAILAQQKFVNTHSFFTHEQYIPDFDWTKDESNMRNLQRVSIQNQNGRLLHVLNHHGYHIKEHKNGDAKTLESCQIIADYISKLEGEIVLCGDFNLSPDSLSLKVLNESLINLPIRENLTTTRTSLTHKKEVCDYIFINSKVKTKSFGVSDEMVSDHKALILELDL